MREGEEVRPEAILVPPSCPFLASAISEHNEKPRRNRFVGWEGRDIDFNTLNSEHLKIIGIESSPRPVKRQREFEKMKA